MKRIYLACPYSHADAAVREWRYQAVTKVAAMLILSQDVMVLSPISHSHPIVTLTDDVELGSDYNYWMPFDEEMMDWADEIWVLELDGWEESEGVSQERDYATSQSKPTRYIDPLEWGVTSSPPTASPVQIIDIKEIRKVKDAQYGDPSISLTNIGLSWTATLQQYYGITLDKPIPAPIVAQMYANAKLIRLATPNLPKAGFDDNLVDTKVYVDIIEETEAKTRQV